MRTRQFALLAISTMILAATFTRPTLQLEQPTYRYVYVFDITQSMNVTDIPNTNASISRLEYAKQMAGESFSLLPCGTEIGLALFTGHRAFLLITPIEICSNYREIAGVLNDIDWTMTWEARSEVAKGLYKSLSLMKRLDTPTRLVFLTDGHEAPPINPDLPPRFPLEKGEIDGLIIGVGGGEPVPIPKLDETGTQQGFWKMDEVMHIDAYNQQRDAREGTQTSNSGNEHLSSLRSTYLKDLAKITGLSYHTLSGAEKFATQLQSETLGIAKIETTDMRWLFALGSLLCFVLSISSVSTRRSPHPL